MTKEKDSFHSGLRFLFTTVERYLNCPHLNFTYGSLVPEIGREGERERGREGGREGGREWVYRAAQTIPETITVH